MLKAANNLQPEHLNELVEVDSAMFDRPRISKVFGTMTRKGPGTRERPHRRAQLISAPKKLEPVQIDSIMKLINSGRRSDPIEDIPQPKSSKSRIKPLSEIENDPNIKPCLKEIILNEDIKQLEEVAAHEHKGRVAIATELILAGYSDEALHGFFSRLADYDPKVTTVQINQIIKKFVEGKGGKTWLCNTLRDTEVIPSNRCEECKWVGHGQDPSIILVSRVKTNPRILKDPSIIKFMAQLRKNDRIEFDLLIEAIKRARVGVTVPTITGYLDKYDLENQKVTARPTEASEDIKDKARTIATKGDPYKYLVWQGQRNHLGDISYQKVLIGSIASTASLTSQGIQPGGTGDKGSGKSDACAATYHLVPMDRRLDGSLSPMSLFYLQETGKLKAGMVLFSDDVEYEPIIPIYKRSTARFQQGITHYTVKRRKESRSNGIAYTTENVMVVNFR
jgi:hypothetical protein